MLKRRRQKKPYGLKFILQNYASSHGQWGGVTVVTRDNTGHVRVFFGRVCGKPHIHGGTLDKAYAFFCGPEWEEVQRREGRNRA